MNKEIELKARVNEPEKTKKLLESLYGEAENILKDDIYYIYRNIGTEHGQPVRLRSENNKNVVTLKQKSVANGVEINDELEFEVDNPENFLKYMQLTGAEQWLTKKKRGWKFDSDTDAGQAVIELCEVIGLGWFLEIEIVIESPEQDQIEKAMNTIHKILEAAEISSDKIEPRYYSEMLRSRQ